MSKTILSLDGGGIRGAVPAKFLSELEDYLNEYIYDLFDMFVGTSTGGIIAALLGVTQTSGSEIVEIYNYENANRIMNKSFWDHRLGIMQNQPKYDGIGKREVLNEYFGEGRFLRNASKPVILTAYDIENRKSRILKSTGGYPIRTIDAVDATSAAPFYFPPVYVDGMWLIDGGVIANNPAMCAYTEANDLWPGEEIKILSIGTGSNIRKIDGHEAVKFGAIDWIKHDFLGIVMDESIVHHQLKTLLGENYYRVNSHLDYCNDDMDDCSRGNIENLKRLGSEWFDTHGNNVRKFLEK